SGSRWQAHATFTADDQGSVDVSRTAPTEGTYDGVAPMGLVWSAEPLASAVSPLPPVGAVMHPGFVDLEAKGLDGTGGRPTIERRVAGPGVSRHPIRSSGVVGTLFLPPGDEPNAAVMVLSGGGGGINEEGGAIMASRGYAALALGYFGLEGLPRGLVNIPLE